MEHQPQRKAQMDQFGTLGMILFAVLLAFSQVVVRVTNEGIQPVFFAGIRSLGAAFLLLFWMRLRGIPLDFTRAPLSGLWVALLFSGQFMFLFLALDYTTVARASVLFYTMPIWLTLVAHFLIPDERIIFKKGIGLALAFGGVVCALAWPHDGRASGADGILGDIYAIAGAMCWAAIAVSARITPLRTLRIEMQLFWQLLVSGPILIGTALFFGPFLRDPELIHWAGLGFQIVVIAFAAFLAWFWFISIYPASSIASFSFLSPIFGVAMGWLFLGEEVGLELLLALGLVCVGLILINRR
ncbi:EamA family transporter [Rhodobacterales bacterium LSUCC0246]|nr:EamA family transporter [Rhodobacterales bacterium LSUCC0374]